MSLKVPKHLGESIGQNGAAVVAGRASFGRPPSVWSTAAVGVRTEGPVVVWFRSNRRSSVSWVFFRLLVAPTSESFLARCKTITVSPRKLEYGSGMS